MSASGIFATAIICFSIVIVVALVCGTLIKIFAAIAEPFSKDVLDENKDKDGL